MRAIIHVDGDAFFASCEIAQNERLRGKPVVTGQEKGMAIAVSYAAKARGISRGMLMSDIRKICPEVTILPGNYDLYKIYSRRMCAIVRRYAPRVEEYSVDECFADISAVSDSWGVLVEIAHKIKRDLEHDLGMTFSLGLAPTKTLAKVASSWKKPSGFTAMKGDDPLEIHTFLKDVPVGEVWGIGYSTSAKLQKLGIKTALDFVMKSQTWIEEHLAKPHQELWYELHGVTMHRVGEGNQEKHKSIRATRTFRPPTQDISFILSELSKNAEKACAKLRRHNLQSKNVYFYLKTQSFSYKGQEIRFDIPITNPSDIMNAVKKAFFSVYRRGVDYRASGIVLNAISPLSMHQPDLFGLVQYVDDKTKLYTKIDELYKKFGKAGVFIASSMKSRLRDQARRTISPSTHISDICLRLGIPYWGEAI